MFWFSRRWSVWALTRLDASKPHVDTSAFIYATITSLLTHIFTWRAWLNPTTYMSQSHQNGFTMGLLSLIKQLLTIGDGGFLRLFKSQGKQHSLGWTLAPPAEDEDGRGHTGEGEEEQALSRAACSKGWQPSCVDSSWNWEKSCKAKSWMFGSADNWALLLFLLSAKHLWLRCTMMLYSLLLRSKTERIGLCHTRGPAPTCLFALQSAKQISLPLENQVGRTCQRRGCASQSSGRSSPVWQKTWDDLVTTHDQWITRLEWKVADGMGDSTASVWKRTH